MNQNTPKAVSRIKWQVYVGHEKGGFFPRGIGFRSKKKALLYASACIEKGQLVQVKKV